MKRFVASLVLVMLASQTYGQGQTLDRALIHNGISRNYTIYVPSSYTPQNRRPLVVNLHGVTLNRSFQMAATGMNAVAEREGFLAVYPDAVNGDWSGPQDNIGFIDTLLNQVTSQYSIDASKVYATGFSQGGAMSYILSVARPYKFAAIASVSGPRLLASGDTLFPTDLPLVPPRPFPILHMHGTGDSLVPYNGGIGVFDFRFPSVERVVSDHVLNNGGDTTANVFDFPNTNTTDGSTVQMISYDGASYLDTAGNARPADVVLYRILNAGHNWPGDFTEWPAWAPPVNRDISASDEIWKLFSRHTLAIPEPSCVLLALVGLAVSIACVHRQNRGLATQRVPGG